MSRVSINECRGPARLFELVGKLVKERMAKLVVEEQLETFWRTEGTTPRGSELQHVHLLRQAERLSPNPTTDGSPR